MEIVLNSAECAKCSRETYIPVEIRDGGAISWKCNNPDCDNEDFY